MEPVQGWPDARPEGAKQPERTGAYVRTRSLRGAAIAERPRIRTAPTERLETAFPTDRAATRQMAIASPPARSLRAD